MAERFLFGCRFFSFLTIKSKYLIKIAQKKTFVFDIQHRRMRLKWGGGSKK